MQIPISVLVCLAVTMSISGCGSNSTPESSTPEVTAPDVVAPSITISAALPLTTEIGCAKCIYNVEGATDCSQIAAKIEGKPVVISGIELNAHDMGLCSEAKTASIQGSMEDGKLVATKVELQ